VVARLRQSSLDLTARVRRSQSMKHQSTVHVKTVRRDPTGAISDLGRLFEGTKRHWDQGVWVVGVDEVKSKV
jgi:hypothetical protein